MLTSRCQNGSQNHRISQCGREPRSLVSIIHMTLESDWLSANEESSRMNRASWPGSMNLRGHWHFALQSHCDALTLTTTSRFTASMHALVTSVRSSSRADSSSADSCSGSTLSRVMKPMVRGLKRAPLADPRPMELARTLQYISIVEHGKQ